MFITRKNAAMLLQRIKDLLCELSFKDSLIAYEQF